MRREDLKKLLGEHATDEVLDGIMKLNGSDLEDQKAKAAKLQTDFDALKAQSESQAAQLTEAGKTIEGFKAMNIDQVKASAAEWQAKAEQAQKDAAAQVAALKFDHALDGALTGAKAKNAKAVRALLDPATMKLNDDGSILGLKEQLEKVKTENAYLFDGEVTDPHIVAGATPPTTPTMSAAVAAAYKAAGITPK